MRQMVRPPKEIRNPVLQNSIPPLPGIAVRSVTCFDARYLTTLSQRIIRYYDGDPGCIRRENMSVEDGLLSGAGR
jgi:hypothetical protein